MSPLSRGISNRIPNMDSVLILTGASHPSISTHILIAVAFTILGFGSLETSTLLPIPLYGCRGALTLADLSGKQACKNIAFLDATRSEAEHQFQLWSCGADSWWQLTDWPGCVIAVGRLLLAISAGLGLDAFGRKRSAIVWMAVYFTASLARSFSPNNEVFATAVTIEALSSQFTSLALLLIATEGSIQKESVRSACHVLIGHSLGVIVFIPVLNSSISSEMFRQLAKSLPSIYFILLIFFLPESIRWIISQGRLEDASPVLQKSHKVNVEEALRPKLASVYNDMRKCLSECRSRGNSVRQAILPIIFARPMWRVFLPFILISFLQGSAIGFRLIHDPMPYQSVEDRVIACGVAELLALHLLGLLLARLPVRRVLFSLSATFAALLLLTRALKLGGYVSCVADMFFSSGGHFITVTTWVWLIIGVIRITPTHSRGTVLGFVVGFGTLGHALSLLIFKTLTVSLEWNEYFAALLYSGVVILSGLLVLILPSTPFVIPDMTSHLAPHLHWTTEEITLNEHDSRNDIDTRL